MRRKNVEAENPLEPNASNLPLIVFEHAHRRPAMLVGVTQKAAWYEMLRSNADMDMVI